MNEIIGIIKMVEREIVGYANYNEKKIAAARTAPEIEKKHNELLELIKKHGSDELVNKYYKQLSHDISRIIEVKEPPRSNLRFN